nr:hypothetical protein [Iodidimonas nitroreducens]
MLGKPRLPHHPPGDPPMITRYSRPEMTALWSAESKFGIWFEIEAHACDAQAALGIIPLKRQKPCGSAAGSRWRGSTRSRPK